MFRCGEGGMRVAHRHGSVMGKATIRIRRPRACVESLGEGSEGERSIRMWCPAAWANRRPQTTDTNNSNDGGRQ